MTTIAVENTSAHFPLKVFSQTRARNQVDKAPAAQLPVRRSREELEKIGSEIVAVASRGTAIVNGAPQTVTRDVPTPRFKTLGYEALNEFITETSERELREYQKALANAALRPSRSERVVDSWSEPRALFTIPPKGASQVVKGVEFIPHRAELQIEENQRVLISCDETVSLQVGNTTGRTLRLRNRDAETATDSHVAFIAPGPNSAIVTANGKAAAVIELMPN